jgi:hypothetical protein
VHVLGSAAGNPCVIEGSYDGVTWFTLTDPQGTALNFLADGLRQIAEVTLFTRPRVIGGEGSDVTAAFMCRRKRSAVEA